MLGRETGGTRRCDVCGAEFEPIQASQLRCSFACKQEANRRRARERYKRQSAERAERYARIHGRSR